MFDVAGSRVAVVRFRRRERERASRLVEVFMVGLGCGGFGWVWRSDVGGVCTSFGDGDLELSLFLNAFCSVEVEACSWIVRGKSGLSFMLMVSDVWPVSDVNV